MTAWGFAGEQSFLRLASTTKLPQSRYANRVAFAPEQVADALLDLTNKTAVTDAVIVSTCNRTELYFSGSEQQSKQVIAWLAQFHQLSLPDVEPHLYLHQDDAAASHLMRVACGLDSLVLGEPQILGQVKQAYSQSRPARNYSAGV